MTSSCAPPSEEEGLRRRARRLKAKLQQVHAQVAFGLAFAVLVVPVVVACQSHGVMTR